MILSKILGLFGSSGNKLDKVINFMALQNDNKKTKTPSRYETPSTGKTPQVEIQPQAEK